MIYLTAQFMIQIYNSIKMNNPFLSDRNIFSKVVNPIKKRPQPITQKQQSKPTQNPAKPLAVATSYQGYQTDPNFTKKQQKSTPPPIYSSHSQSQPLHKMSFGTIQQSKKRSYEEDYYTAPRNQPQQPYKQLSNSNKIENASKLEDSIGDSYQPYQYSSSLATKQVISPGKPGDFQDYRRKNNLTHMSPIEPQHLLGDSEFLNLDAMGDDLNKFLAESKNQEELCKILGIERKQTRTQPLRQQIPQTVLKDSSFKPNNEQFSKKSRQTSNYDSSKRQTYQAPKNYIADGQSGPKIPYIFNKQQRNQKKPEISAAMATQQNPIQKRSQDHIPTFNYVGFAQQNSTYSNEEESIAPNFNTNMGGRMKQSSRMASSVGDHEEPVVFNYSQFPVEKKQENLEDIISQEMMAMAVSGKYRTFLSATEKIVAVKYKLEPI